MRSIFGMTESPRRTYHPEPDGDGIPVDGPFQWDRVTTAADDRTIAIEFGGGPDFDPAHWYTVRYTATFDETEDTVTVLVSGSSRPPPTDTPLLREDRGYPREVQVVLSAPLGDRRVINAATSLAHPVNVDPWTPPRA